MVGAEPKKGLVGGEYLQLSSYLVDLVSFRRKFIGLLANRHLLYDLRFLQPLSLSGVASAVGVGAIALPFSTWLVPIKAHTKETSHMSYQPILDIVQAKAAELATLTKELENTKA